MIRFDLNPLVADLEVCGLGLEIVMIGMLKIPAYDLPYL